MTGPVAVTGAGGYVGGRLVDYLAASGVPVRAIVSNSREWLDREMVTERVVDYSDRDGVESALDGCTSLVHLAGANEVAAAMDAAGSSASTLAAAYTAAGAATQAGIERVVFVSTMHVYGARIAPGAILTEDLRCEPRHPYAVARLAAEHAIGSAAPSPVILRLTNSLGAPAAATVDRWTLVANDLARQAVVDGVLHVRDPNAQRDFVALADVVSIITSTLDTEAVPPNTYNLGFGELRTVGWLAEAIVDATTAIIGRRPTVELAKPVEQPADPYRVDISRLGRLGLSCDTPIEDAVAETVRFCQEFVAAGDG